MARRKARNMLIAQSGGPTAVINQSLVGAVLEAQKHPEICDIYGALHGIKGVLSGNLVDLGKESLRSLEAVAETPSAALGTVRKKPTTDECRAVFSVLQEHGIGYFFYIGGNDSAETTLILSKEAEEADVDLHCFHIPKTIDNDLRENDHSPGFGSAAKFVACAFMGDNLDNRALPGVKINIVMGRHAGFLTAASALARIFPDDGPHLIYMPERPFSTTQFVKDVTRVYKKHGRCLVAVSEGVCDSSGVAIASKFIKEHDAHGNVQLSGSGALGDSLVAILKAKSDITRVRADTFGYLQRSFPGVVSIRDAQEARAVGIEAVRQAVLGVKRGSIAICRKPQRDYRISLKCVELERVAKETRSMPPRFISPLGNDVTTAFLDYARPIVGELPRIGRLRATKVRK